ncbi:thiol:disulfide interchange protein DsbA/DsbL [Shewanella waksmanii]|uniref:thiol:disulfide interchange protein DsbA/DsbL n=1 Tax=Shewanella waksmanii TaxID=213783 RepID=UPI003736F1A6
MKMKLVTGHRWRFFALVLGLLVSTVSAADFTEGKDYTQVAGIPESQMPVVREFFSYNCGHCYRHDPHIEQTAALLDDGITFTRTPVGAGRDSWILSQKAYYIANQLQVSKLMHPKIFDHIHQQQGPFSRQQQVIDLFEANGVDGQKVKAILDSADLQLAVSNYDTQTQLSGIRGVPALLVNGKYLVNSINLPAAELAELITYLSELQ